MPQRVTVVGAGVIGLTCAVRLAEAGVAVDVLARDLPLESASAAGGGLWLPVRPGWGGGRETAWARTTLAELRAVEGPASGVRTLAGRLAGVPDADWADAFAGGTRERDDGGWRVHLPVADSRRYLPWLRARLEAAGGTLTRAALPALPSRGVVVDAAGVAARALADDPQVEAVRTQVVVAADPGLDGWRWGPDGVVVLPYGDLVLVEGPGEPGEWSTAPDPAAGRALLDRAARLVPQLSGADVAGLRVALRPARPAVRLETGPPDADRVVVHCYGHGSRGFTLSWGCADEVTQLVTALDALPG